MCDLRPVLLRVGTALVLMATLAHGQQGIVCKQVAAPADDIVSGLVALPDASTLRSSSRTALLPVDVGPGRTVVRIEVPVADPGELTLVPLAPDADRWTVAVQGPDDIGHDLERLVATGRARRTWGALHPLLPGAAARTDLVHDMPGVWTITVGVPGPIAEATRAGYLLLSDGSPRHLVSGLTTHELRTDREVGLVAWLADEDGEPLAGAIVSAELHVGGADGPVRLLMQDDGRHQDGARGDGVFGAVLAGLGPGDVRTRIVVRGRAASGHELLRTAQHTFPLHVPAVALTGTVATRLQEDLRLELGLGARALGALGKLHVSGEVWGTRPDGDIVPVCWLSGMVVPAETGTDTSLPLSLDLRWLGVAGANAPLELRAVRVQHPDTHVPLARLERLPLDLPRLDVPAGPTTPDMLMGGASAPVIALPPSVPFLKPRSLTTPGGPPDPPQPGLMLVHGYCSGGSVWPAAQFSQPKLEFLDPDVSRSHDEFALLMQQAGGGLDSFGVVGHSQGGAAALHLYTYYRSGLDHAAGGRRIQSVATPYQGTPLAGDLAALGDIFGSGCGTNFDLSPDGAALWLAGIPSWARAEVHYWTTSTGGSWCNFFTNFVLTNPEDGVVEHFRAQLTGANSMGHKTGWCHTTGMNDPANYLDAARNAEMDAQASR